MKELPVAPRWTFSLAEAINNRGEIIGEVSEAGVRRTGVLWTR